jgi:hypothetical protein
MSLSFPQSVTVRWDPLVDLQLPEDVRVVHSWSEKWEFSTGESLIVCLSLICAGHSISRDVVVLEKFPQTNSVK